MGKNRVTSLLGIEYPIVQAPMSWITNAELVAAVSNAGGLGMLGPNAGQTVSTADPVETAEGTRREIRKTRTLTGKPFGVTYLLPQFGQTEDPFSREILKVCVQEHVNILSVVGLADDAAVAVVAQLKALGFTVMFREGIPTVAGAQRIAAAGADIYVATGFDEGGDLPLYEIGTFAIVPMIAENVDIPVLAAGGVVDKKTVKAALILGAEGVYVGTRFIASVECPASRACKDDIVACETADLVLFKSMPSFLRCTPHAFALECHAADRAGASRSELGKMVGAKPRVRLGMLEGKLDEGLCLVSNAVGRIKSILPCAEIIRQMFDGVAF